MVNFFKAQVVAAIDDFTILVKCGAVQEVVIEKIRTDVLLSTDPYAGAKAQPIFHPFAARLKSCPVTKRRLSRIPKPTVVRLCGLSTAVLRITSPFRTRLPFLRLAAPPSRI
jgi:hypothetical protein